MMVLFPLRESDPLKEKMWEEEGSPFHLVPKKSQLLLTPHSSVCSGSGAESRWGRRLPPPSDLPRGSHTEVPAPCKTPLASRGANAWLTLAAEVT